MEQNTNISITDRLYEARDYIIEMVWEHRGAITQATIGFGEIGTSIFVAADANTALAHGASYLLCGLGFANFIDAGLRTVYSNCDSATYTTIESRLINWVRSR